nr:hypothetical protein BHI3_09910 [Bacteriovorax sp. HI3]
MEKDYSDHLLKGKTIGDFIREARLSRNMDINELSSHTKIHKTLLLKIENNELRSLPSKPYVVGFLRSISSALDISFHESLRLMEETPHLTANKNRKKSVSGHLMILRSHLPLFYRRREFISWKWFFASLFLFALILFTLPMVIEQKMAGKLIEENGRHIASEPMDKNTRLKNQDSVI